MLWLLWKLPIKLRYSDIESLAEQVQNMRITEKELNEYVEHLKTYIKEE